jgi:hypothetical protein
MVYAVGIGAFFVALFGWGCFSSIRRRDTKRAMVFGGLAVFWLSLALLLIHDLHNTNNGWLWMGSPGCHGGPNKFC